MADKLYTVVDGMPSELNLGSGGSLPGIDERVTALEAYQIEQDESIASVDDAVSALIEDVGGLRADMENSTEQLQVAIKSVVPAGTVIAFASNTIPEGYLLCNGSAISRSSYADLFAAIGTLYGSGNGTTTFNLPSLTDKFIQGGVAGTVKSPGLPNIAGYDVMAWSGINSGAVNNGGDRSGALSAPLQTRTGSLEYDRGTSNSAYVPRGVAINASLSNAIYGSSSTVQPPAVTMRYCIKY